MPDPRPEEVEDHADKIVGEATEAQIEEAAARIRAAFEDGFQFEDVVTVAEEAKAFADLNALTPEEKWWLALRVTNRVIDGLRWGCLAGPLFKRLAKRLAPVLLAALTDWEPKERT